MSARVSVSVSEIFFQSSFQSGPMRHATREVEFSNKQAGVYFRIERRVFGS